MAATIATKTLTGADPVVFQPGLGDNVAILLISGDYTGFSAEFFTSQDGVTYNPLVGIDMLGYQPIGPFIYPQAGAPFSVGFNLGANDKFLKLNSLSYGSGSIVLDIASFVLTNGIPIVQPPVQTPVSDTKSGAAQQLVASLPAVPGKTNYITGFSIDGLGANSAGIKAAILTGVVTPLAFIFIVPAGAQTPLGAGALRSVILPAPIPAIGTNVAITLTVPNFGAGNVDAEVQLSGYNQ